jgi:hypothetical protein
MVGAMGRRFLITWRLVAVAVILFGPIAMAHWELSRPARGVGDPAPEEEARYRSRRSPVIDELLPNGQGGIRIVETLDGQAGVTFTGSATIALAASVVSDPWPGTVELHERAHLVDAFMPDVVARVMAVLPAPAPGEYAATNPGEHFAEMAAGAWELVVAPDGICVEGTPLELLRSAEARVPGTAGFVSWYLQNPTLASTEVAGELRPLADQLIAPHRAEWEALWRALNHRRLPDGAFTAWRAKTVREHLNDQRASARGSDNWIDRLASFALAPSLGVLMVLGR